MWALGRQIQERYEWYEDWVDCAHESNFGSGDYWGLPNWGDPDCGFRLKPNIKSPIRKHKHFWLILLWSLGFSIQERSYWNREWQDVDSPANWRDLHNQTKFRLKLFRKASPK
jgi:hypothetical protein